MPDVRIEDLREPRRTPQEQQIYDTGARHGGRPGSRRAGRGGPSGAPGWTTSATRRCSTGSRAQVAAVEADAGLSGLGRFLVRQRLVGLLAARLRFEDYVRRHPEALDVELEPPVIVVGLPRSGTTHLVNLLATDGRFRSMPWWEVQEPIPVMGDGPGRDGVDPRYLRCLRRVRGDASRCRRSRAHARPPAVLHRGGVRADGPRPVHLRAGVVRPGARRGGTTTSGWTSDAHYAFLRRELQVLSHLRGPNRWVLKCPQHLEQLGPLHGHVPRRHDRLHPARPGRGAAVGDHDAGLRRPQPPGRDRRRRARRVLGRPHRAPAARRGARRRT